MVEAQLPERKSTRLKDFDYSSLKAYFITICSLDKNTIFTNDAFNAKIIKLLLEEKKRLGFLIYVYCLMPDHLHLLLSPPGDGESISAFIGAFKSKATRLAWSYGIDGKIWQGRFHDHIVRKKEGLTKVGEYILNNPVRKGLSDSWQNYSFCDVVDAWS